NRDSRRSIPGRGSGGVVVLPRSSVKSGAPEGPSGRWASRSRQDKGQVAGSFHRPKAAEGRIPAVMKVTVRTGPVNTNSCTQGGILRSDTPRQAAQTLPADDFVKFFTYSPLPLRPPSAE